MLKGGDVPSVSQEYTNHLIKYDFKNLSFNKIDIAIMNAYSSQCMSNTICTDFLQSYQKFWDNIVNDYYLTIGKIYQMQQDNTTIEAYGQKFVANQMVDVVDLEIDVLPIDGRN